MNIKRVILNILDYLRYQVENDKCTSDELKSILEMVSESMEISATIKDMAEFYGQSESNVSNVISAAAAETAEAAPLRISGRGGVIVQYRGYMVPFGDAIASPQLYRLLFSIPSASQSALNAFL